MSALVGASDVEYLGYVTFCGAVAASLAGIAFGWLSDLTRNRRGLIAAGLVLTILLLLAVPLAGDVGTLIGIIILWQLALNMMLSRSEEHTSELQSLMRISYAVFCLKKKTMTQHMKISIVTRHHIINTCKANADKR